jgi:tRNA A37 methylthiotransferase MiaB
MAAKTKVPKFKNDMELAEYLAHKRIAKLEKLIKQINEEIMTYRFGDNRVDVLIDRTGSMIQLKLDIKFYC